MTNGQIIQAHYPKHAERIKQLARMEFWNGEPEMRGSNYALAAAFDWHRSVEGWEYWHALYERGEQT